MAKYPIILAVLLLLSPFAMAQESMQLFIHASFEPDQAVATQALLGDGGYTLVSADGIETYIIDSSGKAVKDKASLEAILANDAKQRGGFDASVASAQSFAAEALGAKQANEAKCMQYLGLNMYNCTDRQSCIVACFAVPQCNYIINAAGFVEAMMDYNSGRQQFDSYLSSFSENIDSVKTDTSAIDRKLSVLGSMGVLAANISINPIFLNRTDPQCQGNNASGCFEYCPKADYSPSRIEAQKQNLASLKTVVAGIVQQASRAAAILNKTNANDAYLSGRAANFDQFRLQMNGDLAELKPKNASFAKKVDDPEASRMIVSLSNLSAEIMSKADAGYYRQAMGQKAGYNAALAEIEGRMSSELAACDNLTAEFSFTKDSINKSAWLIGANASSAYYAEVIAIEADVAAPATVSGIISAQATLVQIKARLAQDVAAQAMQNPQGIAGAAAGAAATQAKASIPCLPAFAVLAALLFAGASTPRRK